MVCLSMLRQTCQQHFGRLPAHLVVFSCEHLDAHDGEYQPEDEAHQKHVEDAGNRLDQGIDDDLLYTKESS